MIPFLSSRLPFRWNLWIAARLLPLFTKNRPLDELLRRATPPLTQSAYAGIPAETIVAEVKAMVSKPWRMRGRRCLREGLLAFYYLAAAGYRPILQFGLVPESVLTSKLRAHCWIILDGKTVLNPPARPMLNLFAYDGSATISADQAAQAASEFHD